MFVWVNCVCVKKTVLREGDVFVWVSCDCVCEG